MDQRTVVVLLSVIVTALAIGSPTVTYREVGNCSNGFRNMRIYSRSEVLSESECLDQCTRSSTCKSLNYENKTTRTCQLLKKTAGQSAPHLIPKKGWSYLEKTGRTPSKSCSKHRYNGCKARVKSIGSMERVYVKSGTRGYWGKDTYRGDDPRVYYVDSYSTNKLYIYANEDAVTKDDKETRTMPFTTHGTTVIVHDNIFYSRQSNDRYVVAYNIDRDLIENRIGFNSADVGFDAGYSDQCSYDGNHYTAMDMMADQNGVYVLWGRNSESCKASLSKINTTTFEIEETWHSQIHKTEFGEGFMVCGRIYFNEHYNSNPDELVAIWDYRTGNETTYRNLNEYRLPGFFWLPQPQGYNYNTHFNPTDGKLYMKSNTYWLRFAIEYDQNEDYLPV